MRPRVGVLALQGDVREHGAALEEAGAEAVRVRRPRELASVDGLVVPGGESTTIAKLAVHFDLMEPLRGAVARGLPVLGTCAGMVLLADRVLDGAAGQRTVGGLDVTVRRNGFGRQVDSFEQELEMVGVRGRLRAVFIRAPYVVDVGPEVEVLATLEEGRDPGRIVGVRQGSLMATSFHPEVGGDSRVHRSFVDLVRQAPVRRETTDTRGTTHGRPLQVGDHEAQEGGDRRQARQALRQADQEHRGGRPLGRR